MFAFLHQQLNPIQIMRISIAHTYFSIISIVFLLHTQKLEAGNNVNDTIKFGLITDIQYCNCPPSGTRFYSHSLRKTRQALDSLNEINLSFILHTGDLIDRDIQSYSSILPLFKNMKMPCYFAYGNHDYNVPDKMKDSLNAIHGQKNDYFSFKIQNWNFIILNTNDISKYSHPANSTQAQLSDSIISTLKNAGRKNILPWNGGIGSEQMNWLTNTLSVAQQNNEKVILFGHHPVYPASADNALNDIEIIRLLEKYPCIKAYFCGHHHDGNFAVNNNIYYINLKSVVDTPDSTSFAWIELTSNTMFIHGYGRENLRKINFK